MAARLRAMDLAVSTHEQNFVDICPVPWRLCKELLALSLYAANCLEQHNIFLVETYLQTPFMGVGFH